jgi:hypothetical protein
MVVGDGIFVYLSLIKSSQMVVFPGFLLSRSDNRNHPSPEFNRLGDLLNVQ